MGLGETGMAQPQTIEYPYFYQACTSGNTQDAMDFAFLRSREAKESMEKSGLPWMRGILQSLPVSAGNWLKTIYMDAIISQKNMGFGADTMENMTEITQNMYNSAIQMKTVAQARELLATYGQFRGLADVLRAFADCAEPKDKIANAIMAFDPTKRRDSTDKKVRNWLNGTTTTLDKKDVYYLCRAMNFSLEQTDAMLKYITDEGIHWRDPEDILWCYAIANRLDYERTSQLLQRGAYLAERRGIAPVPVPGSFTEDVRLDVQPMLNRSEEELLAYLDRSRSLLGAYHNTAYDLFMEYNDILEGVGTPEKVKIDGKVSSRYILEKYLFRRLIPTAKRGGEKDKERFSAVQRSIRMNWPDETTYSRMKSRELDVSRKVMIMLFLAVDDGEPEEKDQPEDYDYEAYDAYEESDAFMQEPLSRDEMFQMLKGRVNQMLHSCGFQKLDPRSPFDWIILFCMCTEDMLELDKKLEGTLAAMFPEGNEKQLEP